MKGSYIILLLVGGVILLYFLSKRQSGTSTASTTPSSITSSTSSSGYSSIVPNLPSDVLFGKLGFSPMVPAYGLVHGPAQPIDQNPPSPVVVTYPTFSQPIRPIPMASTVTSTPIVTQVNKPYTSLNVQYW